MLGNKVNLIADQEGGRAAPSFEAARGVNPTGNIVLTRHEYPQFNRNVSINFGKDRTIPVTESKVTKQRTGRITSGSLFSTIKVPGKSSDDKDSKLSLQPCISPDNFQELENEEIRKASENIKSQVGEHKIYESFGPEHLAEWGIKNHKKRSIVLDDGKVIYIFETENNIPQYYGYSIPFGSNTSEAFYKTSIINAAKGSNNLEQATKVKFNGSSIDVLFAGRFIGQEDNANISQITILNWLPGVLKGLSELHSKGFIHTYINNTTVGPNGQDAEGIIQRLDMAVWNPNRKCPMVMDAEYITDNKMFMPPESYMECSLSHKSDIWSLGILILNLLTGGTLLSKIEEKISNAIPNYKEVENVIDKSLLFFVYVEQSVDSIMAGLNLSMTGPGSILMENGRKSPYSFRYIDIRNFLGKMLKIDPDKRASAKELLEEFGSGVHKYSKQCVYRYNHNNTSFVNLLQENPTVSRLCPDIVNKLNYKFFTMFGNLMDRVIEVNRDNYYITRSSQVITFFTSFINYTTNRAQGSCIFEVQDVQLIYAIFEKVFEGNIFKYM